MDQLKVQKIFDYPECQDNRQLQTFFGILNYKSKFQPNLANTAAILTDLQGITHTTGCIDTYLPAFNRYRERIINGQVITSWHNTSEERKYVTCNLSDIGLASWLRQETLDRFRPAWFHCCQFNPAQLSYDTLQEQLFAIIDSLQFLEAQVHGTKFTILTDHQTLETFLHETQALQKLRHWLEFLESSDQTIVHTAGKENVIADVIFWLYIRIGTSTKEEDFIPDSIANTALQSISV